MSVPVLKALVVDDDPIARKMVAFALQSEGFQCDLATDGVEALGWIETWEYDLVVTDLRMPNKNGYDLSIEMLKRKVTPVLVVHSSVDDPHMAKYLMASGVDDIIYKPVNYAAFAVKVKALVERRRNAKLEAVATESPDPRHDSHEAATFGATDHLHQDGRIGIAEFELRLSTVCKILPLSQAVMLLLDEISKDEASLTAIAGIIQQDASLTADVLRLANSAYYNGTPHAILDIAEAVSRIGMRSLAELALAMSAMGALSKFVVPWFDMELASQRSLAGGIAVSRLLDAIGQESHEVGMVLAAVMYPLGRVILGTLYPSHYELMLATSRTKLVALRELEHEVFPEPQSAATARVLAQWGLPKEICGPLTCISQTFGSVSSRSEPNRSNVSLVKTGILLGQLAIGRWLSEDLIDFPSASQVRNLGTALIVKLIDQIRLDLKTVKSNRPAPDIHRQGMPSPTRTKEVSRKLKYCNLSPEPVDFLRLQLTSMGFELEDVPSDVRDFEDPLVVNCMHAPATRLAAKRGPTDGLPWVIVVSNELPEAFQNGAEIIRLPASCGALRAACERVAAASGVECYSHGSGKGVSHEMHLNLS